MEGMKWGKARYLDASALVKLYVVEPHSDVVRAFMNAHPKPFNTTSLCFAEALNVLKRKWLKKELTTDAYLKATHRLTVAAWGKEIELQNYGLVDPFVHNDVERIVQAHNIDVSDALQLLTLLKGRHSVLVRESASVLITADTGLATAAAAEGVRVWNCAAGPAPSWA